MKKLFLLFLCCSSNLLAFEVIGNPMIWSMDDFIGFDEVGDCESKGDISSAYAKIINDKLFLRITFDDMYSRENKIDLFDDNFLQLSLKIKGDNNEYFKEIINVADHIRNHATYYFLRTLNYNLIELEINWPYEVLKENLMFEINMVHKEKIVDKFLTNGDRNENGGNVAFVHHGNQGLTYSQVF